MKIGEAFVIIFRLCWRSRIVGPLREFAKFLSRNTRAGSNPVSSAQIQCIISSHGGLAERFMALVLKTSERKLSQVQILYPPQN